MSQLVTKKFSQPDERRPFLAHGHAEEGSADLAARAVSRQGEVRS